MIVTGENGSQLVVVDAPNANKLIGMWWTRKSPIGDAGDVIRSTGLTTEVHGRESVEAVFTVTPSAWGEVPEGWTSTIETMSFDELTDEYAPMAPAEVGVEAASRSIESKTADAAVTKSKRISPWRRA